MNRFELSALRAGLAMSALLVANAAQAGWQKTEWGMTAEEVAAAMGGEAPLDHGKRGDRLGDNEVRNVGKFSLDDSKFRTVYYYDAKGLSHVALIRRSGDCEKITTKLFAEYGKPQRISDQAILRLIIWHDAPTQTRIRLLVSKDICDINYERLSDYLDSDLEAVRRG